MTRALGRAGATALLAASCLLGLAAAAAATTADTTGPSGNIAAFSEGDDGTLNITFQADNIPARAHIDTDSVQVTVNERPLKVIGAEPLSQTANKPKQVAVLALDHSQSMNRGKLDSAKDAAKAFVQSVPSDVQIGLVTFGREAVSEVDPPTTDHARVLAAIDAITLDTDTGTALFDAVETSLEMTGDEGARTVILLTDGRNAGGSTTAEEAAADVAQSGVGVNAVFIGTDPTGSEELKTLVGDQGLVRQPGPDAEALTKIFEGEARTLNTALQITATVPARLAGKEGKVEVVADAGGTSINDTTQYSFPNVVAPPDYGPQPVKSSPPLVGGSLLPFALGAMFVGFAVLLAMLLAGGDRSDRKHGRVRRRLSFYTLTGRPGPKREPTTTALGSSQVARSAVELAGRVVQRRDFEADLSTRLEAAGVPLRAAEWMLIHIGVAIALAMLLLLISGGALLPTLVGLVLGLVLPWLYLGYKESRRTSAFLGQLPDTLQLLSGSLSAGYAMAQAIDTVVREGQQPISGEFNRALVEARLGVPIEDALEGVATRMKSKDFEWVVMAIRIQREVGGNLAELLTTVSGTLRERDRLRRQVKVLSAEGRLSAWILGLLPLGFALYLLLVRPEYLKPLVTDPLGWLMLVVGVVLLGVGSLWMVKAVKVEV